MTFERRFSRSLRWHVDEIGHQLLVALANRVQQFLFALRHSHASPPEGLGGIFTYRLHCRPAAGRSAALLQRPACWLLFGLAHAATPGSRATTADRGEGRNAPGATASRAGHAACPAGPAAEKGLGVPGEPGHSQCSDTLESHGMNRISLDA